MTLSDGQFSPPPTKRACKRCRGRKIKCDSLPTCGKCLAAQAPCEYSVPRRRGPKPASWRERAARLESATDHVDHVDQVDHTIVVDFDHHSSTSPSLSPPAGGRPPSLSGWSPSEPVAEQNHTPAFLFAPQITAAPPASPCSDAPENQTHAAISIHLALLAALLAALGPPETTAAGTTAAGPTAADIANRCIYLYTRYVFGAFPLCHEATVRAAVNRFFIPLMGDGAQDWTLVSMCFAADNEQDRVAALKSVTVLTALCAAVSYVVPEALLPSKHLVAPLFLRAARQTLRIYEDYDLEHPDSSSLAIRHFFSSAIQSATGASGAAFHFLNQSGLLAMKMRLYDERSLEGLDPIEETILRNTFWQLYVCDQTAVIMKGRPVTIHEALFETGFTVMERSPRSVPLLMHEDPVEGARLEESLAAGFHVICRLWTMGARVVHGMEALSRGSAPGAALADMENRCAAVARLSATYFEVITLTGELPVLPGQHLLDEASPGGSSSHGGGGSGTADQHFQQHLRDMLQRQRTSYLLTLHSIKIMILNIAVYCGVPEVLGMSAEPTTLAMRLIELAQDFVRLLESVPFVHLQTEGEHCSEKIRWIGSLLLEMSHDAADEVVKARAGEVALRLVDMLARLDSKASDILAQQMDF